MTTDEFNTRYKLLKQIAHGKGRSFTAQECSGGRAVLVHFRPEAETASNMALPGLIDRLSPRDRSRILEILTVNTSTVVVTQFLEDFQGFDAWLHDRLANPAAPVPGPSSPPAPSAGEFTGLFAPPPEAMARPAPVPPPAPQAPPQGSFTELFRTPPEAKPKPFAVSPPSAPPVELRSVRLPLSDPLPPRAPAVMAPWGSTPEPPRLPPLQRPALQGPILPSPMLPSPIPPSPRLNEPIVKPPLRDALPPPAPLPGWSGESDYTRQLRSVPAPADPIPAPAILAPPPEPQGGRRSLVPLLLMLNIVVIIATGLILYFALKR